MTKNPTVLDRASIHAPVTERVVVRKVYRKSVTAEMFHGSDKFVRGIMGPFGSGKSTMCCWEIMMKAHAQEPDESGVRRTRWCVIRNTFPELKSTTIQTWKDWFGRVGHMTYGSPIEFKANFPIADGTRVDLHVYFLALDLEKDMRKLLSLELTGAWINEARELSQTALINLRGRVGRFPSSGGGRSGATWSGIIMDTNPPDDDHWWYELAEEVRPRNHAFFQQPGGYVEVSDGVFEPNPKAENLENLKGGHRYYYNLMDGAKRDWIRVHVCGRYGNIRMGRLVYPEYDDSIHCAKEAFEPYRGIPLVLGWDFGLTPAVVFCQQLPSGEFRVVDEICAVDMPLRQFLTDVVKPHIRIHYSDLILNSYGDPAGGGRSQTDGDSCINILNQNGIITVPSPVQNPLGRRDAVSKHLLRRGGFLISPKCKVLRKGFLSKYVHDRIRVSTDPNDVRYKDEPVKNFYSHVHDALQYACVGGNAPFINSEKVRMGARPVKRVSLEAWS